MNKSYTYLYPLVQQELFLKNHEFISNTYALHSTYDDCFTISYKFAEPCSQLDSIKLCYLDKAFKKSSNVLDIVDSEDKLETNYTIQRPTRLAESFAHIEQGMYSKINEKHKYTILTFLNKYYPFYEKEINIVKFVLFRDPTYRKSLSIDLGYNIPEDVELSSKLDKNVEMFIN